MEKNKQFSSKNKTNKPFLVVVVVAERLWSSMSKKKKVLPLFTKNSQRSSEKKEGAGIDCFSKSQSNKKKQSERDQC
jgi:hypothetical protein